MAIPNGHRGAPLQHVDDALFIPRFDRAVGSADLDRGLLTIGQATRRMRKIVGMTQAEYAEKILKLYPRVLMEIERDRGNPTLKTLEKIARPFGLRIGFVAKASQLPGAESGGG